ncbi:MAG TPA: Verru_Chthon cassette protein C [Chthoniobacteraceae bacterium]|nr:Verru_Chthon cassette protein C [Chthoniobacteraceae bacterium]
MKLPRSRPAEAFTLVEVLVSTAIIGLLVVILASVTNQTSTIWRRTTAKAEQFREARAAFEQMTTRLGQATLNTYFAYDDPDHPTRYDRRSELRFICGPADDVLGAPGRGGGERPTHCVFFQAPFGETENPNFRGFENLLTTRGYWVQLDDDRDSRPPFLDEDMLPVRYRYRLMELWQPAETNTIYKWTSGDANYTGREWFRDALAVAPSPAHVLAENVIALIVTPRLAQADERDVKGGNISNADDSPLAPNYVYDTSPVLGGAPDSRYHDARLNPIHQLPPLLQVTMVAIDELSAERLDFYAGTHNPFTINRRFRRSADFTKDLALAGDAASLENTLVDMKVNYRIFTTNVVIRGAKWSREQTNLVPGS